MLQNKPQDMFFTPLRTAFLYKTNHIFLDPSSILLPYFPFAISNTVVSLKVKVPYQERKIPTVLDKRNGPLTLTSERSSAVWYSGREKMILRQKKLGHSGVSSPPLRLLHLPEANYCPLFWLASALFWDNKSPQAKWTNILWEHADIQRNIKKNIYLYCLKNIHLT